jgi:hypothetical protein
MITAAAICCYFLVGLVVLYRLAYRRAKTI